MSQAEDPRRTERERAGEVSVEDVKELIGPATPHFALQLRNRIARLIAGLPVEHPARVEGEREIARLELLGVAGETRGQQGEGAERPMPSLRSARRSPESGLAAGRQL